MDSHQAFDTDAQSTVHLYNLYGVYVDRKKIQPELEDTVPDLAPVSDDTVSCFPVLAMDKVTYSGFCTQVRMPNAHKDLIRSRISLLIVIAVSAPSATDMIGN
jgi:hypothetical protein